MTVVQSDSRRNRLKPNHRIIAVEDLLGDLRGVSRPSHELESRVSSGVLDVISDGCIDPNSQEGVRVRRMLDDSLLSTGSSQIFGVCNRFRNNSSWIPGTVNCYATIDQSEYFNMNLLRSAVAHDVIEDTHGSGYRIPLVDPRRPFDSSHGRSIYTMTLPSFIFKGVGKSGTGRRTAFFHDTNDEIEAWHFQGGHRTDYLRSEIDTALKLRSLFRRHKDTDPVLLAARMYGVSEDMFIKPVAVFNPQWIPAMRSNSNLDGIKLVRHSVGMSMSHIPRSLASQHRVYCYQVTVPERMDDLGSFDENKPGWDRTIEYVEGLYAPGLSGKDLRMKIALRDAAGCAVMNHLVHHMLGGSCTTKTGSVFQKEWPNKNFVNFFDYDSIRDASDFKTLMGRRDSLLFYQDWDLSMTRDRIREGCRQVGLDKNNLRFVRSEFDRIYNLGA